MSLERVPHGLTVRTLAAECIGVQTIVSLAGGTGLDAVKRRLAGGVWPGSHPYSIGEDYPVGEDLDAWFRAGAAHGVLDHLRGRPGLGSDGGREQPSPPLDERQAAAATVVYVAGYFTARGLMGIQ